MATYIPQTAIDFVTSMVKGMPFTVDVGTVSADRISKIVWTAAPWSWTLGSLDPAVSIVASTQDYTITKPADFYYLERSYLWDGNKEIDLNIEASLPTLVTTPGIPSRVALIAGVSTKLRFAPIPTKAYTNVNLYKKTYPAITSLNVATPGALILPDEWAWVYEQGMLWQAYLYADDRRAGEATISNDGKRQYTGQLGMFMAALQEMRESEKALIRSPSGDQQRG